MLFEGLMFILKTLIMARLLRALPKKMAGECANVDWPIYCAVMVKKTKIDAVVVADEKIKCYFCQRIDIIHPNI